MYYFFLDASALTKRHHQEVGSDVLTHLLEARAMDLQSVDNDPP